MRIFLALVAHLFFASIQAEIPAALFKDITKQFKDPHYSPLMGRVALDSGLIYNYRMYGNFIPADNFVNDAPQDAPMELLLFLFPSSAGELASSSTAKSNFGKSATIDDVVNMLKYAKAVRNIMEDDKFNKLRRITEIKSEITPQKIKNMIRDSIILEYGKVVLTPSNSSAENSRSSTPTSSSDEDSSTPTSSGKSTPTKRNQTPLSPTLQDIKGDVLYPKFTTEQIILAFFVFQFNTQNDLDELIKGMGEFLGNVPSTDSEDLDQDFIDTYHYPDAPIPYKYGNPISDGNCPYITMNANGEKVFDSTRGTFADCQETAIRELLNIILYNKESDTFKLSEGLKNKHLIDFYEKQLPISANDGSSSMRGAWNLVVGGIPGVRYNEENGNNLDPGFLNTIKVLRHVLGIDMDMPLPNDEEGVIAALKKVIGYLNPTFKDVQIEINDFSESMTYNGKDFFGTAIVQITNQEDKTLFFFFYQSTIYGAIHDITYETIDPGRYGEMSFNGLLMNLVNKRNPKKGLYTLFADGTMLDDHQKLSLLKNTVKEMRESYVPIIERVISSLTVRDAYNTKQLIEVYTGIVNRGFMYEGAIEVASKGIVSEDEVVKSSAFNLFTALVEKGQEHIYEAAINTASQGMKSMNGYVRYSALSLFKALFEKGQGYDKAIEVASQGMTSKDYSVITYSLELFKSLVKREQEYIYETAIEVASQCITSTDYGVGSSALYLFKALIEKGQGYEAAIAVAKKGMTSRDGVTLELALELYEALVEKGAGYEEAIEAASKGMTSRDGVTLELALKLYKALVEKGKGYDQAIAAASKSMASNNYKVREFAVTLFKDLLRLLKSHIEKGDDQIYAIAIKAASKAVTSTDRKVKSSAFSLFTVLVEKEEGYEAATEAASDGIVSKDYTEGNSALKFFKVLLSKGQGLDAFSRVISSIQNPYVKGQAEALLAQYSVQ